ncbi:MAG: hypothetical protein IJW40_08100 [Clostridia bacterium]|nr:hypothetical protein [Clostridia bacterium]
MKILDHIDHRALPPIDVKKVFRYMGYSDVLPARDSEIYDLLQELIDELPSMLYCRLCYRSIPLRSDAFPFLQSSAQLKAMLNDCGYMVVYALTLGPIVDEKILVYSDLSPIKAMMLEALGGERAEALSALFLYGMTNDLSKKGYNVTSLASPGCDDWPLQAQAEIIALLQCETSIGITLNEHNIMTPSKSMTAVFGVKEIKQ